MNKFEFIDYVTLIPSNPRDKKRKKEITQCLAKLKKMASDRNIDITLLSSSKKARKAKDE